MSKETKNLNENDCLNKINNEENINPNSNDIEDANVNKIDFDNAENLDLSNNEADNNTLGEFSDSALAEGVVSLGIFGENEDIKEANSTDEATILKTEGISSLCDQTESEESRISEEFDVMTNIIDGQKRKPRKKRRRKTKVRKIVVRTYATVISAVICIVVVYFASSFFKISPAQGMTGAELKVDMDGLPHIVGTIGPVDLNKVYPDGKDFKSDTVSIKNGIINNISSIYDDGNVKSFTITFTQTVNEEEELVEKEVQIIEDAVNVDNWEDFVKRLKNKMAPDKNSDKEEFYPTICLQNNYIAAPVMEGTKKNKMEGLKVYGDIYGNGCTLNVFEIVVCRNKFSSGSLTKPYLQGNGPVSGWSAFWVCAKEDGSQITIQDLHITGNDMKTEEGGNLYGVNQTILDRRGLKLFSAYGTLLSVEGETTTDAAGNKEIIQKANLKLKHCVLENSHKLIHVRCADMEFEGNIIRNASDTALSFATYAYERSVVTSRNNVISNSLTGGVVFYCYDGAISNANAEESWNELLIEKGTFLDIYNWKEQDGLAFMPETEGGAEVANPVAKSEIPKTKYDSLKANVEGKKYIHFAIIKLRTGGGLAQNGSYVTNYQDIGYQTSRDKGYENGFPLPSLAAAIIRDIDVWGYYERGDRDVTPTAILSQEVLDKLYEELKFGRKK